MSDISHNNNIVSPEAKLALDQLKAEALRELDIANYQKKDRKNLTSRQNGYVGGYMTTKPVDLDEQTITKGTTTKGTTTKG